ARSSVALDWARSLENRALIAATAREEPADLAEPGVSSTPAPRRLREMPAPLCTRGCVAETCQSATCARHSRSRDTSGPPWTAPPLGAPPVAPEPASRCVA